MLQYVPGFALLLAISLPARFIQSQITVNGKEVVSAVAIAIFGLLAVLFYPLLGLSLGLSDRFFGTWAGTAVNSSRGYIQ